MGYKRINVNIAEELLKDMDALIKAGFYASRRELIAKALLSIEPLKSMAEKRHSEMLGQLMERIKPLTTKTDFEKIGKKLRQ